MTDRSCETCRYWMPCGSGETLAEAQAGTVGDSGECRRHAPTRLLADAPAALAELAGGDPREYATGQLRRVFPITFRWDECGDWQKLPE